MAIFRILSVGVRLSTSSACKRLQVREKRRIESERHVPRAAGRVLGRSVRSDEESIP